MAVAGKYAITIKTPLGPQDGSLEFVVNGNSLSGTITNPKGTAEFTNGTVNGNEVSFEAKIPTPIGKITAHIDGKVDGDIFTAIAKVPLGSVEVQGKRKPS